MSDKRKLVPIVNLKDWSELQNSFVKIIICYCNRLMRQD